MHRHVHDAMGTVFSMQAHSASLDRSELVDAVDHACALIDADEQIFSLWIGDSPLSQLARGTLRYSDAPAIVHDVRERCIQLRSDTRSWFDPWYDHTRFDPTGMVKGWSAGRALALLRAAGVDAAMVNAGGDITCFGQREPGQPWHAGVRDPSASDRLLCVLQLDAGSDVCAVATSGSYERGDHVRNPRDGSPACAAAAATVVGPALDVADALATSLLCAGAAGLDYVEQLPGYDALVLLGDRQARCTTGFTSRLAGG